MRDGHVDGSFKNVLALYSMRDKSFRHLPPIPQLKEEFPAYSECVSLDGKLYVLGGMKKWCRYPSIDPLMDLGSHSGICARRGWADGVEKVFKYASAKTSVWVWCTGRENLCIRGYFAIPTCLWLKGV